MSETDYLEWELERQRRALRALLLGGPERREDGPEEEIRRRPAELKAAGRDAAGRAGQMLRREAPADPGGGEAVRRASRDRPRRERGAPESPEGAGRRVPEAGSGRRRRSQRRPAPPPRERRRHGGRERGRPPGRPGAGSGPPQAAAGARWPRAAPFPRRRTAGGGFWKRGAGALLGSGTPPPPSRRRTPPGPCPRRSSGTPGGMTAVLRYIERDRAAGNPPAAQAEGGVRRAADADAL